MMSDREIKDTASADRRHKIDHDAETEAWDTHAQELSHPIDTFTDDDDDPTQDETRDLFGDEQTAHLFQRLESRCKVNDLLLVLVLLLVVVLLLVLL